jgi:hypothetical protein
MIYNPFGVFVEIEGRKYDVDEASTILQMQPKHEVKILADFPIVANFNNLRPYIEFANYSRDMIELENADRQEFYPIEHITPGCWIVHPLRNAQMALIKSGLPKVIGGADELRVYDLKIDSETALLLADYEKVDYKNDQRFYSLDGPIFSKNLQSDLDFALLAKTGCNLMIDGQYHNFGFDTTYNFITKNGKYHFVI